MIDGVEEDELHLIGETREPLFPPKFLLVAALNIILISPTATWLVRRQFKLDLFGTIPATLTLWLTAISLYLGYGLFQRISERELLSEEFKDYVVSWGYF